MYKSDKNDVFGTVGYIVVVRWLLRAEDFDFTPTFSNKTAFRRGTPIRRHICSDNSWKRRKDSKAIDTQR